MIKNVLYDHNWRVSNFQGWFSLDMLNTTFKSIHLFLHYHLNFLHSTHSVRLCMHVCIVSWSMARYIGHVIHTQSQLKKNAFPDYFTQEWLTLSLFQFVLVLIRPLLRVDSPVPCGLKMELATQLTILTWCCLLELNTMFSPSFSGLAPWIVQAQLVPGRRPRFWSWTSQYITMARF